MLPTRLYRVYRSPRLAAAGGVTLLALLLYSWTNGLYALPGIFGFLTVLYFLIHTRKTGAAAFGDGAPPTINGEVSRTNEEETMDLLRQSLPAQDAPNQEGPALEASFPVLLLVEDDADLRSYLSRHLVPAYEVVEAADGEAGLAMALQQSPDLVLSEVRTSGVDGLDLCRQMRRDAQLRTVPLILLSGKAGTEDGIRGLEIGANDYMTKPFSMRELQARIHNQLVVHRHTEAQPRPRPAVPRTERDFLERLRRVVGENLSSPSFAIEDLANALAISRRQLQRKVRNLTGQSPQQYLCTLRLETARQFLCEGAYATVAEVAQAVGLSRYYFSRLYRQRYGHVPSKDNARRKHKT